VVSNSQLVARELARIPEVKTKLAILVERVGSRVVVNIGLTSVTLPFVGLYLPPVGHAVQMDYRDGRWVVSGPASPLPGEGTITTASTPRAVVTAWGVPYTLRHASSYTPVLNDLVGITWSADEGIIDGKLSAASGVTPPATNPGGGGLQTYHPPQFTAIDSGSWNGSRWWTNDVYASASNDGAFFYGSKIRDTIPDSASIISCGVYIPIRTINVNAPGQMRLHLNATKPGGAPTFSGSASPIPATSGWHPVPNAWIDVLKSGNGGIGFDGGGYWIIRGNGSDAQAGALDIYYQA
jgi:hypothetical protein